MADKPVLETGALRVRVQVPLPAPPGRAWSRYALRVFSFTGCTARVLTGIFLYPADKRMSTEVDCYKIVDFVDIYVALAVIIKYGAKRRFINK